jgi:hypothetical protein
MKNQNDCIQRSTLKSCTLTAGALVLAIASSVYGADKPAAAPASAGLANDWLRKQSDEFKKWDIGGQVRLRYELSDGGASFAPARDFQATGIDNHNAYLLVREKLHVGYAPCAEFNVYVEGRDSSSTGDDNPANPGADEFDLHQAYFTLGDATKFPVTVLNGW